MRPMYTSIIAVLVIIVLTVGGYMWLAQQEMTSCMEASRVRQVNVDGSSWEGPDQKWVESCMGR